MNSFGMYNYDATVELLMNLNMENRNYIVEQLKEVYLAGDANNDGNIGMNEFLMLFRHMEPKKYSYFDGLCFFRGIVIE